MEKPNRKKCMIFSKNLRYYMNLHGRRRDDLVKDLGFKYSTICNWLSCYSYASKERIEKLANYFGISTYQLTENENEQPPIHSSFKKRKQLNDIFTHLTDEQIDVLLSVAEQFKEK